MQVVTWPSSLQMQHLRADPCLLLDAICLLRDARAKLLAAGSLRRGANGSQMVRGCRWAAATPG